MASPTSRVEEGQETRLWEMKAPDQAERGMMTWDLSMEYAMTYKGGISRVN
jgi:hypothetical protein